MLCVLCVSGVNRRSHHYKGTSMQGAQRKVLLSGRAVFLSRVKPHALMRGNLTNLQKEFASEITPDIFQICSGLLNSLLRHRYDNCPNKTAYAATIDDTGAFNDT